MPILGLSTNPSLLGIVTNGVILRKPHIRFPKAAFFSDAGPYSDGPLFRFQFLARCRSVGRSERYGKGVGQMRSWAIAGSLHFHGSCKNPKIRRNGLTSQGLCTRKLKAWPNPLKVSRPRHQVRNPAGLFGVSVSDSGTRGRETVKSMSRPSWVKERRPPMAFRRR